MKMCSYLKIHIFHTISNPPFQSDTLLSTTLYCAESYQHLIVANNLSKKVSRKLTASDMRLIFPLVVSNLRYGLQLSTVTRHWVLTLVRQNLQLGRGLDGVAGCVLHHTLVHGLVPLILDRFDPENRPTGHLQYDEARVAADAPVVLAPLDLGLWAPRGAAGEGRHTITHDSLVPGAFLKLWRVCQGQTKRGVRVRSLHTVKVNRVRVARLGEVRLQVPSNTRVANDKINKSSSAVTRQVASLRSNHRHFYKEIPRADICLLGWTMNFIKEDLSESPQYYYVHSTPP